MVGKAEAKGTFNCGTNCRGITMGYGDSVFQNGNGLYIPNGKKVLLEGSTNNNSLFNIEYVLVKGYNNKTSVVATWAGGNNWKWVDITEPGTYYIKAICKDSSSSYRCSGQGSISY